MRLDLSEDDAAFRLSARDWLAANVPDQRAPLDGQPARDFALDWLARCHGGGWSGLAWPQAYGGRGLSPERLLLWYEEYVKARAPSVLDCTFVALNHAGPTVIACGSDAQKAFHLPRILEGQVIWCQGFSEPGAGSDLSALKTTGRIEGDELVVNGQKIWTSFADVADYQELLIRTDPGSTRHAGLSWVICDMRSPGITVRPIRNMAGANHFAEVFYDDVRIPLSNVVGQLNDGWAVAMTTLGFERKTAALAVQLELSVKVEDLIAAAQPKPGSALAETLADLRAEAAALRSMTYRALLRDPATPFDGSMVRLPFAELAQRVHQVAMDIAGPKGLIDEPWSHDYLESYSETIAGGTAEIQRNIIAERILGLPPGEARMSWTLNLDDDQRQILDAAQSLLDEHYPMERLHKADAVDALAPIAEFGGFALALPDALDGTGFTAVEEALVHVQFGRHLVSTSALAAPIGARLCALGGQNDLARQIALGEVSVCAGVASDGDVLLLDMASARYGVVWEKDGLSLLDLAAAELQFADFMGHGRQVANLAISSAKVVARSDAPELTRIADLLVSAQLLGVAQASLALAVSYAGLREQFGRPIGSFQAIKHQCADMAVRAELLSAQLDMAAIATRDGREDADFQVAALRRLAPRAALANARRAIQIHGGIGFSAEANAHHFLKHAHVLRQLGGSRDLMAMAAPLAPNERP